MLPSLAEGISNTILEAMASGAAGGRDRVGGNADLVDDGETGEIVPAGRRRGAGGALLRLATRPGSAPRRMGAQAARAAAEARFSIAAMVRAYQTLYDRAAGSARAGATPTGS